MLDKVQNNFSETRRDEVRGVAQKNSAPSLTTNNGISKVLDFIDLHRFVRESPFTLRERLFEGIAGQGVSC
jgi:hypothetical protein